MEAVEAPGPHPARDGAAIEPEPAELVDAKDAVLRAGLGKEGLIAVRCVG